MVAPSVCMRPVHLLFSLFLALALLAPAGGSSTTFKLGVYADGERLEAVMAEDQDAREAAVQFLNRHGIDLIHSDMIEAAFLQLRGEKATIPTPHRGIAETVLTLPLEINGAPVDFVARSNESLEEAVAAFSEQQGLSADDAATLLKEARRRLPQQQATSLLQTPPVQRPPPQQAPPPWHLPPVPVASLVVSVDGVDHRVDQLAGETAEAAAAAFASRFGLGNDAAEAVRDELVRAAAASPAEKQPLAPQQLAPEAQAAAAAAEADAAQLAAQLRAQQASAALRARAATEHNPKDPDAVYVDLKINGEDAPLLLRRQDEAEAAAREYCAFVGTAAEDHVAFVLKETQMAVGKANARAAAAAAAATAKAGQSAAAQPAASWSALFEAARHRAVPLMETAWQEAFVHWEVYLMVAAVAATVAFVSRRQRIAREARRRRRLYLPKAAAALASSTKAEKPRCCGDGGHSPERGPPPVEEKSQSVCGAKDSSANSGHARDPQLPASSSSGPATAAADLAGAAPVHGASAAEEGAKAGAGQSAAATSAAPAAAAAADFTWEAFVAEEAARPGAALVELCVLSAAGVVFAETPNFQIEAHEACALVRLLRSKAPEGVLGGRRYAVAARDERLLLLTAKEGGHGRALAAKTRTAIFVARYGELSKAEAREAAEAVVARLAALKR